jgi:hypothetical protein
MPQIQKKSSSEFEAGGWIDMERKAKEGKRKREISLEALTQKLWYLRGSLWNGTKTKNWKLSGSELVVVSFPPWQSSFPPDALYLFLFLSGFRATKVSAMPQIQKNISFALFFLRPKEVNLKRWLDRSKNQKRRKESAKFLK